MSDTPENKDEKYERSLHSIHIINVGVMGTCVLFLTTMIAIPKLDGDLIAAAIAFAIALPLLAVASSTYLVELLPDWTILISSPLGWLAFVIGMSNVFSHINPLALVVGWVIYELLFLSWLAGLIMISMKRMRARRKMKKQMQQQAAAVKIRLMASAAARNGTQRPPHSHIVQREMKYHRPIEHSRASNRKISRGSS